MISSTPFAASGLAAAATGMAVVLLAAAPPLGAQADSPAVAAHVAAAKTAAGTEWEGLFSRLCAAPPAPAAAPAQPRPAGPPDRATWYAAPVKVFDNLYYVG